jgi:hypothetical protein
MSRMGNFFSAASPQLAKTNRNKTINDRYFFMTSSFLSVVNVEFVVKNTEMMIRLFLPTTNDELYFRLTSFFQGDPSTGKGSDSIG